MYAVLYGLDRLDEIVAYQENNQKNLKKEFEIEQYPSKSSPFVVTHTKTNKQLVICVAV